MDQFENKHINLLVTLNETYIPYLNTMLFSLLRKNKGCSFTVYLLHSSINDASVKDTKEILGATNELVMIYADDFGLDEAPVTKQFPKEMYYRIFAAKYLPENVDRVLYLDPDIVVNGSILPLYSLPMGDYYFAAASHNGKLMRDINGVRLKLEKGTPYINSGLMLMNLDLLRKEQDYDSVFSYIEDNKDSLLLPDQDVISGLYGNRIYELDPYIYNMTERLYRHRRVFGEKIDVQWIRENSVIIHYCGKNKPWKENYKGKLNVFYNEILDCMCKL